MSAIICISLAPSSLATHLIVYPLFLSRSSSGKICIFSSSHSSFLSASFVFPPIPRNPKLSSQTSTRVYHIALLFLPPSVCMALYLHAIHYYTTSYNNVNHPYATDSMDLDDFQTMHSISQCPFSQHVLSSKDKTAIAFH